MLWRALKHVKQGLYVDVGAQHPVIDSVSLAFYEHGWRGVHIEPVPAYANLLRKHRPDEVVIQAAVGAKQGLLTFFDIKETGLSTADEDIAYRHREAGLEVREIVVPCLTLDEALSPFAGKEIHWLKIDVEGYECQVLEGWGSTIRPWVVVIESTLPRTQTESYQDWEHLILGLGYKCKYFDGLNRFYISAEHADLQDAFRCGPNFFDDFALSGSATAPFCTNLTFRIEELRQHRQALEKQLTHLRTQSDTLRESLATAQQHTACLEGELAQSRERLRAPENEFTQTRNAMMQMENRLSAREAELATVYHSLSWRLTAPLRLPRRAARRVLLSALMYLRTRPERMAKITRALARFPFLYSRLGKFSRTRIQTQDASVWTGLSPGGADPITANRFRRQLELELIRRRQSRRG